jgi:hypothetical protein
MKWNKTKGEENNELIKLKIENRREKTEEWEIKGYACWPSHYPSSPCFLLYFHYKRVFFGQRERMQRKKSCVNC